MNIFSAFLPFFLSLHNIFSLNIKKSFDVPYVRVGNSRFFFSTLPHTLSFLLSSHFPFHGSHIIYDLCALFRVCTCNEDIQRFHYVPFCYYVSLYTQE